jgi:hypothetical protein
MCDSDDDDFEDDPKRDAASKKRSIEQASR